MIKRKHTMRVEEGKNFFIIARKSKINKTSPFLSSLRTLIIKSA